MSEKNKITAEELNFDKPSQLEFNLSMQETLQRELEELEILLSLNNDIASVRHKNEILEIIQPKLKQLFNTGDIYICVLDKVRQTLNPLLRTAGEKRRNDKEYGKMMNSHFPVADGFINTILQTGQPLIFDLAEVSIWP